jgi:uncharacterized protein YeaC (DUF1315 family)
MKDREFDLYPSPSLQIATSPSLQIATSPFLQINEPDCSSAESCKAQCGSGKHKSYCGNKLWRQKSDCGRKVTLWKQKSECGDKSQTVETKGKLWRQKSDYGTNSHCENKSQTVETIVTLWKQKSDCGTKVTLWKLKSGCGEKSQTGSKDRNIDFQSILSWKADLYLCNNIAIGTALI